MTQPASLICSISNTSLGKVLVASSMKGVCALYLGGQTDVLLTTLSEDFPLADTFLTRLTELPSPADDWHQTALDIVIGLDAKGPPLDIFGTNFQIAVYKQLLTVPEGTTVNTSELALAIGHPEAVKATVDACRRNKIAILIPCHRVSYTDGDAGRYRWGVELQGTLLEREAS